MSDGLWSGVVGQQVAVGRLRAAVERPVHAYLLVGPAGSGKRAAARAFAAALLCRNGGDGTCRDCRLALAGEHPDLREVEREGAAITAEQAEEIIRLSSRMPIEGSRKVLLLDEFHLIQPTVPPRLLKTIEEPPASTIFVILADDVPPELVTIASRCVRVDFAPLLASTVIDTLVAEGIDLAAAELAAMAAGGNLDRARLLAVDTGLLDRREAFHRLPHRLDGSGAEVTKAVEELLGLIDAAAEPMKDRHKIEVDELETRVEQFGERGAGRKVLAARQSRELRRHRTDELKGGLQVLAAAYRDQLAEGTAPEPAAAVGAVGEIQAAMEALDTNANEALLLQSLLLRMPSA